MSKEESQLGGTWIQASACRTSSALCQFIAGLKRMLSGCHLTYMLELQIELRRIIHCIGRSKVFDQFSSEPTYAVPLANC